MHGRYAFQVSRQSIRALVEYVQLNNNSEPIEYFLEDKANECSCYQACT